jgi:gas vesicle protein
MRSHKLLLGLIGGAAAGALLGILFAPHKGSKTRKRIFNKGKDYADEMKGKLGGLMENFTEKYENIVGHDLKSADKTQN